MKKLFCFSSVLFFYAINVFSLSFGNNGFSISAETGILNGEVLEYVWDKDCKNTDGILSRLDWDVENIPYIKIDYDYSAGNNFFFNFRLLTGIPKESGYMQDYDWMNNYRSWFDSDPKEITNYSKSDNSIDNFVSFDFTLGKRAYKSDLLDFSLFFQWNISSFFFTAKDGYYTYKSYDWKIKYFSGKVISYEQLLSFPFFGFSLNGKFVPKSIVKFDFAFCPSLGSVTALDYHYINRTNGGTAFKDEVKHLSAVQLSGEWNYLLNKNSAIGLKLFCQFTSQDYGKDYIRYLDKNGEFSNNTWIFGGNNVKGGTSSYLYSISLTYTYAF